MEAQEDEALWLQQFLQDESISGNQNHFGFDETQLQGSHDLLEDNTDIACGDSYHVHEECFSLAAAPRFDYNPTSDPNHSGQLGKDCHSPVLMSEEDLYQFNRSSDPATETPDLVSFQTKQHPLGSTVDSLKPNEGVSFINSQVSEAENTTSPSMREARVSKVRDKITRVSKKERESSLREVKITDGYHPLDLINQLDDALQSDSSVSSIFKLESSGLLQQLRLLFNKKSSRASRGNPAVGLPEPIDCTPVSDLINMPLQLSPSLIAGRPSADAQNVPSERGEYETSPSSLAVVLYHCTFPECMFTSNSSKDWRRHEETKKHWPQEKHMCLECPISTFDESGNLWCLFCKSQLSTLDILKTHNLGCKFAQLKGKTFFRDDKLSAHLETHHRVSRAAAIAQTKLWKFDIDSAWPRQCGFCNMEFFHWDMRATHLMDDHFRKGALIQDWNTEREAMPAEMSESTPTYETEHCAAIDRIPLGEQIRISPLTQSQKPLPDALNGIILQDPWIYSPHSHSNAPPLARDMADEQTPRSPGPAPGLMPREPSTVGELLSILQPPGENQSMWGVEATRGGTTKPTFSSPRNQSVHRQTPQCTDTIDSDLPSLMQLLQMDESGVENETVTPSRQTRTTSPFHLGVEDAEKWYQEQARSKISWSYYKNSQKIALPGASLLIKLADRDHTFIIDHKMKESKFWDGACNLIKLLSSIICEASKDGIESIDLYREGHSACYKEKSPAKIFNMLQRPLKEPYKPNKEALTLQSILKGLVSNYARGYLERTSKPGRCRDRSRSIYILYNLDRGRENHFLDTLSCASKCLQDLGLVESHPAIQFITFGGGQEVSEDTRKKDSARYEERIQQTDNVDITPSDGNLWKMLLGASDPTFDVADNVEETDSVIKQEENEFTSGK